MAAYDWKSSMDDFVIRYNRGSASDGFSGEEALQRYVEVVRRLKLEGNFEDVYKRAAREAFHRIGPDQRVEFARYLLKPGLQGSQQSGFADATELAALAFKQEQESGLLNLFVGDTHGQGLADQLNRPVVKAVLGGIAASVTKEINFSS